MKQHNPVVSIQEARRILGDDAAGMNDEEIAQVVETLDILAKDALDLATLQLRRKKDARELAILIYDIYQDKKRFETDK